MSPKLKRVLADKQTAKNARKKVVSRSKKLTDAAKEALAKKVSSIRSNAQVLGELVEKVHKDKRAEFLPLVETLEEEFQHESESRILIGSTLNQIRTVLGSAWDGFLDSYVVKQLRKSRSTCFNYIGLANVFNLAFDANEVVKQYLARIWGAEGCYDASNGELLPVVQEAIDLCGGIPESTDSLTCDVWVHKFVLVVDSLVGDKRSAKLKGNRDWNAETIKKKGTFMVKSFRTFLKNAGRSKTRDLLKRILVVALAAEAIPVKDVMQAVAEAKLQVSRDVATSRKEQEEVDAERAELPADMEEEEQQEIARQSNRYNDQMQLKA